MRFERAVVRILEAIKDRNDWVHQKKANSVSIPKDFTEENE
jgi:hypothetical protein